MNLKKLRPTRRDFIFALLGGCAAYGIPGSAYVGERYFNAQKHNDEIDRTLSVNLDTLCLADQSFQGKFPDWENLIESIVAFSNSRFGELGITLDPEIKSWDNSAIRPSFDDYFKVLVGHESDYDRVIGFTDIDLPGASGMAEERTVVVSHYGEFVCSDLVREVTPFIYKFGLKKLTLHELGHTFDLVDSVGYKYSIMDYAFGIGTSNFTGLQKLKIQKHVKSMK